MAKLSKKKSRFIFIISGLLVITAITLTFLYSSNALDGVFAGIMAKNAPSGSSGEDISHKEGEQTSVSGDTTVITQPPLPLEEPELPSDKRLVLLKNIETHELMTDGMIADLRIRYANGEEYTILKNIRLTLLNSETDGIRVFATLTEIERLYFSSALTDIAIYSETLIFPAAVEGLAEEHCIGNYRPVREVITLINEEGFMEAELTDEIYLARERLEERLLSSSVYYREAVQSALENGGFYSNGEENYWIVN